MRSQSFQSCLTLCDPTDWSLAGTSVQAILQARILEWVAMHSSRGSSPARDQTQLSCVFCIAGRFFIAEPSEKPNDFMPLLIRINSLKVAMTMKIGRQNSILPVLSPIRAQKKCYQLFLCNASSQTSRILPGGDLSAADPACLAGKGLVLLASSCLPSGWRPSDSSPVRDAFEPIMTVKTNVNK